MYSQDLVVPIKIGNNCLQILQAIALNQYQRYRQHINYQQRY